jgi:hypothetical protein
VVEIELQLQGQFDFSASAMPADRTGGESPGETVQSTGVSLILALIDATPEHHQVFILGTPISPLSHVLARLAPVTSNDLRVVQNIKPNRGI